MSQAKVIQMSRVHAPAKSAKPQERSGSTADLRFRLLISALESDVPRGSEHLDSNAGQPVEACDGERAATKLPGCD
jgi:hypothetical protein